MPSEMAPYLRSVDSTNTELLDALGEKNTKELTGIEDKLKDAEENLGESEISELLRSKAMYLCRIGDKVGRINLASLKFDSNVAGQGNRCIGHGFRENSGRRRTDRSYPRQSPNGTVLLRCRARHRQHRPSHRVSSLLSPLLDILVLMVSD